MPHGSEGIPVSDVCQMSSSLDYGNISAEGVAVALQHMRERLKSTAPRSTQGSVAGESRRPCHGSLLHEDGVLHAFHDGTGVSQPPAAIQQRSRTQQQRRASVASINDRRGNVVGRQAVGECWSRRTRQPKTAIDAEGAARRGRRHIDPAVARILPRDVNECGGGVILADTGSCDRGVGRGKSVLSVARHMTPEARIERHLKRYQRGLQTMFMNNRTGEDREERLKMKQLLSQRGSERCVRSEESSDRDGDEEDEDYDDEHCGRLEVHYGGRDHYLHAAPLPLRPNRADLNQRGANVMYSFTGDSRYKFRSGLGAPLSSVLGPSGSTLRQRSDPVKRGQQVREAWWRDKFLSHHRRKEDRWCTR
ncbi:hypothetical protein ERJ75_000259500 [Trypanosoma vivax]|uniref:Uncharacterized protein n=1 Tax=Trypanosoma vivax (strain Y486) TaxID=1055687 RepID=F9WQS0_TRYVY|nr:hypothetical protein TRVL_00659 [Trypanosoma vivax]KAH8618817.1 hypothetical protein ERJ75_000259500 [Trypanosoma vivax]CCD19902.1 hypothetical protein, conserved [Trypanosoma vivax Y486]|eukprot:CCD19902.1 hypothetical protein, conserved [Trypanosoma vivax Y486]